MYIADSVDKIDTNVKITKDGLDSLTYWNMVKNSKDDYGDEFKNPS